MPRPLKRGIVGASTIFLSKDIDKYASMCGSNFYESDVITDNLCTKQENMGLKSASYNQERFQIKSKL
jgi:hypothetical protein